MFNSSCTVLLTHIIIIHHIYSSLLSTVHLGIYPVRRRELCVRMSQKVKCLVSGVGQLLVFKSVYLVEDKIEDNISPLTGTLSNLMCSLYCQ